MEKRFVLFVVLSMMLLTGHMMLRVWLVPPPEVENIAPDVAQEREGQPVEQPENAELAAEDVEPPTTADSQSELSAAPEPVEDVQLIPQQWVTLGSYDSSTMLVTFNSRGAAIERIELTERTESGELKYLNLDDQSGYLGHLALTLARDGCRVNTVGAGTPAARAGLQVGDVIMAMDGQFALGPEDLETLLSGTKPSDSVNLSVRRSVDAVESTISLTAKMDKRPFQMVQPEPLEPDEVDAHPLSYLVSLIKAGDLETGPGQAEIAELPSLRDSTWEVKEMEGRVPGLEFHFHVKSGPGLSLQVIKRFQLGRPEDIASDSELPPYHLNFDLEIVNHGDQPQQVAYRLDGPTGLPLEGWWYSHKIHPKMFYAGGARDVVFRTPASAGVPKEEFFGNSEIYKTATKNPNAPTTALIPPKDENTDVAEQTLIYLGIDTQYFLAGLLPNSNARAAHPDHYEFDAAEAMALGDLKAKARERARTVDVSFQLDSRSINVPAGESFSRHFVLYSGPKNPQLLAAYGLQDTIYYGWFGVVSKPLSYILHFFYGIVGNYGLAIIMLTVLVRGGMFPLSRKMAKNAAMMQELAPEMKKITEKYKTEMDKRAKAQQELFRKHNYNPLGGCWMMFVQLPIFLGLYRCLSVDIELRQAALIPGVSWCSNLAGPDKLFNWENDFLGLFTETGWLGPYFNILPLITIGMFLVHQKLFMPPATDEQTRMQMKMMNIMMIVMGVMFFKVASGLCLYFIASSLWGIAERKLIPKKSKKPADGGSTGGGGTKVGLAPRDKPPTGSSSNGSNLRRAKAKRNKRR